MKFKINMANVMDVDYDIVIERHFDGVIVVEDGEYDFEGNFTLEQLKENGNKIYIPYIDFALPIKYQFAELAEPQFIGAFITEEKAKNAVRIFDLIYEAEEFIKKNGLDKGHSKKFLWGLQEEIEMLGGNNQVHLENGLEQISFLDEAGELKTLNKELSNYTSAYKGEIYVTEKIVLEKDLKQLRKQKKKK